MMGALAWLKCLFAMVREFQCRKPVTAILEYAPEYFRSLRLESVLDQFSVPQLVVGEVHEGQPPSIPHHVVFYLVYVEEITPTRLIAVYRPAPEPKEEKA